MENMDAHKADLSSLKINRDGAKKSPGSWKRKLYWLWLLLPVVVFFIYQYALHRVTPALKVNIGEVRYITGSTAAADLVATGYVVAQTKAAVSSKATGRLRALNVEEGDLVKKGDIIAQLENEDIVAELDLAKAYLKQARADSIAALLNFDRQKSLLDKGHTTRESFEAATAVYYRTIADVEARLASIRAVEVALENTVIRAPFDGTVLTKTADVGEMVAPMASSASSRGAVVTIADMTSLEVEADVSESNINRVIVGRPCEIILDAYPGQKYRGQVKKIVPTADRARATVMTKITFMEKDEKVLPEMSARVNFMPGDYNEQRKTDSILAVDSEAITIRDGQNIVFTIDRDTARKNMIQIGRKLGDVTEIISGLNHGDRVILSPPGGLDSGDKVTMAE